MSNENSTPEAVAADILSGRIPAPKKAAADAAATRRVCIVPYSGRFRLQWSVLTPASNDWVALYPSDSAPDSDYVSGAWSWATADPKTFDTGVPLQANYQGRYLVWDASADRYTSVARTPAFPDVVMSSILAGYPRAPSNAEWKGLTLAFPNLVRANCWVTAPENNRYNCIAWSIGLDDRWINPASPLSMFQSQYQSWGKKITTKLSPSATIDGWGLSDTMTTHGSKSYTGVSVGASGLWESKLGASYRITHGRQNLTGTAYGSIIASFVPGFSVSFLEVKQMAEIDAPDGDQLSLLAARVAAIPAVVAAEFAVAFEAWKASWFTGDTALSSDTRDLARGEAYEKLKALGAQIIPLLIDRLRDRDNFPALILFDEIQTEKGLVVSYEANDLRQFEGEQARAGRTVLRWIAAQGS